jgi:hypothetical protein
LELLGGEQFILLELHLGETLLKGVQDRRDVGQVGVLGKGHPQAAGARAAHPAHLLEPLLEPGQGLLSELQEQLARFAQPHSSAVALEEDHP